MAVTAHPARLRVGQPDYMIALTVGVLVVLGAYGAFLVSDSARAPLTADVAGNFGGASVFVVPGANGNIGENAEPDATTPQGSSFSIELTADKAGTFRVWGLIEGSECGDSDTVVVSALPDTATEAPTASIGAVILMGLLLFALPATFGARFLMKARR